MEKIVSELFVQHNTQFDWFKKMKQNWLGNWFVRVQHQVGIV